MSEIPEGSVRELLMVLHDIKDELEYIGKAINRVVDQLIEVREQLADISEKTGQ